MAGMYNKKLSIHVDCAFTGKGLTFGGSLIRPEATRYGTAYFAEEMLVTRGLGHEGPRVSVSGSGNVALPCATQNELDPNDAATLVRNGVPCVVAGRTCPRRAMR